MSIKASYFLLAIQIACGSVAQSPFKGQKTAAKLQYKTLEEASGIDASYENPGYLWSHNDSGAEAMLYLLNIESGEIAMEVFLEGVSNYDWEEIVTVKEGDKSIIYVADFGDNKAVREQVKIIRLEEPTLGAEKRISIPELELQVMTFTYEEGARDAESMLFDYATQELIIVTKREKKCMVYSVPFQDGAIGPIKSKGTVPQTNFTAADANESGEILLKNYDDIFYWPASDTSVVSRFLQWNPTEVFYESEPQGEAICWSEMDFFTLSERKVVAQKLLIFERKD